MSNKLLIQIGLHTGRMFLFCLAFFMIVPFLLNLENTLMAVVAILLTIAFALGGVALIRNSINTFFKQSK